MAHARARQFRKRPTIGEMRLWKELRQRDSMPGVMLEVLAALGAVEKPEWNETDDPVRSPHP
jgi:hypothetical protein